MSANIVVLVDVEERVIKLFGTYNRQISFEDSYLLPLFIEDQQVLWVEKGEETEGQDVVKLIEDLRDQLQDPPGERRFFHSTIDGYQKFSEVKLSLAGKRDSKPVDQYPANIFEKSHKLCDAIKEGKIEIISETRANELKKKLANVTSRDKALDSILVPLGTKAEDVAMRDDFFDEEDMISADANGKVETETEQILKKIDHLRTRK